MRFGISQRTTVVPNTVPSGGMCAHDYSGEKVLRHSESLLQWLTHQPMWGETLPLAPVLRR